MFVKERILAKLMKQSYKAEGVTIGVAGDWIILAGGFWVINIAAEEMPNELKGEIVKYLGDIPAEGKYYRVQKDMGIQTMLDVSEVCFIRNRMAAEEEWHFTKIIRNGDSKAQRIMQCKHNKKVAFVDNIIYALISSSDIAAGESMPEKAKKAPASHMFYWDSEIMTLGVAWIAPPEDKEEWIDLQKALSNIVLEEEKVY